MNNDLSASPMQQQQQQQDDDGQGQQQGYAVAVHSPLSSASSSSPVPVPYQQQRQQQQQQQQYQPRRFQTRVLRHRAAAAVPTKEGGSGDIKGPRIIMGADEGADREREVEEEHRPSTATTATSPSSPNASSFSEAGNGNGRQQRNNNNHLVPTAPRTPPLSSSGSRVQRSRTRIIGRNFEQQASARSASASFGCSPRQQKHHQHHQQAGYSPGSNKSLDDADAKTTTTVALSTTATTIASSSCTCTATTAYGAAPTAAGSPTASSPTGSSPTSAHHDQHQHRYTALSDKMQCNYMSPPDTTADATAHASLSADSSLPIPLTMPVNGLLFQHQHQEPNVNNSNNNDDNSNNDVEIRYYRVAYRGVVALLSDPDRSAARSGSYLSYGEVFCTVTRRNNNNDSKKRRGKGGGGSLERLLETTPRLSPRRGRQLADGDGDNNKKPPAEGDSSRNNDYNDAFNLGGIGLAVSSMEGGMSGTTSSDEEADNGHSDLRPHRVENLTLAATLGPQMPSLPSRCGSSSSNSSHNSDSSGSSNSCSETDLRKRGVVRVDHVLTGGYAMDTTLDDQSGSTSRTPISSDTKTPKRSNTHCYVPVPDGDGDNRGESSEVQGDQHAMTSLPTTSRTTPATQDNNTNNPLGYLFVQRQDVQIVELLQHEPRYDAGHFLYKIVSNTPLPILTGPALDAPKTKAMLLPGTAHEVSLRVCIPSTAAAAAAEGDAPAVWFLRLSHRRGWIADRKLSKRGGGSGASASTTVPVVQEVSIDSSSVSIHNDTGDEASIVSSIAVSSVSAPSSVARRRHRPPRRRRGDHNTTSNKRNEHDKSLPRHITPTTTPVKMNKHSSLHDTTSSSCMGTTMADHKALSPTSNLSLLSDDEESLDQRHSNSMRHQQQHGGIIPTHPSSPDLSYATSTARSAASTQQQHQQPPPMMLHKTTPATKKFYLMRVTAPRGLKILDAPQFQVNRLIHGDNSNNNVNPMNVSSSHLVSELESNLHPSGINSKPQHHSIFQTMSGRLTTTGPTTRQSTNPAIFDASSKTRILPRGVLFEASRRMEATSGNGLGSYNSQGAGLIKLSDNSGWAIVPRQDELDQQYRYTNLAAGGPGGGMAIADVKDGEAMRAFEEVGSAVVGDTLDTTLDPSISHPDGVWLRVVTRTGLPVSCPPPSPPLANEKDNEASPSSRGSSSMISGSNQGSTFGPLTSPDSDVASSVGSAFLDAMFRTPKKNRNHTQQDAARPARPVPDSHHQSNSVIPCGMVVQVEQWLGASQNDEQLRQVNDFARLRGGQGWIPLSLSGKQVLSQVPRPEFRFGSFWFRVQSSRGIKVRLGPSRRAPSIKSEDGVYFRFECGEFLRASQITTIFNESGEPEECYAKLYRNRHVRLREANEEIRPLCSLTSEAEWVQVYNNTELFLEECAMEPRIERHKQGWRYTVVPDSGVAVRRGPSFAAEKVDVTLFGGEIVVVNERVSPAGEKITWLRLKDGKGWVHDFSDEGEEIMAANSLRHRSNGIMDRPQKGPAPKEEIAYNTIIARLFHNDGPGGGYRPSQNRSGPQR